MLNAPCRLKALLSKNLSLESVNSVRRVELELDPDPF